MLTEGPPELPGDQTDAQESIEVTQHPPSAEPRLVQVVDEVIRACEHHEATAETVLAQLVGQQTMPEGVAAFLRERIQPTLATIQQQLAMATQVPAARSVLYENARTTLTEFFWQQSQLLEAYQRMTRLNAADALTVAHQVLAQGVDYTQIPDANLAGMVTGTRELNSLVRERVLAELSQRIKHHLEATPIMLEHTRSILITVTAIQSPGERQATIERGWEGQFSQRGRPQAGSGYTLTLSFNQSPDDPGQSRGNGLNKDLNAIVAHLALVFPDFSLYHDLSKPILTIDFR